MPYHRYFAYLDRVHPEYAQQIKTKDFGSDLINDNHWPTTMENYAGISESRRNTLSQNFQELYTSIESRAETYIERSSDKEYDWIYMLAFSAREANRMFSASDRLEMGLIRDAAMAKVASWIIGNGGKTILWAHNVHIAKTDFSMSIFPEVKIKGMGTWLADEFDNRLVSIGAAFGKGEFASEGRVFEEPETGSIDGVLSTVNLENFLIDLRAPTENKGLSEWLTTEQTIRGQEFEMTPYPSSRI